MAVNRCYVYFNKDLQPRALVAVDWFVRINSFRRSLTNCLARTDRVQLDTHIAEMSIGPNVVTYYGNIAKLRDEDGLDVEPFTNFPVTIVT
ncbi:MAG: hypothetical protein KAJ19_13195 [Gammaproteobacteria bacterium]|nr:hypothetical protein [Gammaproteobacteria bacterium]